VFQKTHGGFVMIAQTSEQLSIVGYSDNQDFRAGEMPPQLISLLKFYEDSLSVAGQDNKATKNATPIVAPLLSQYGIRLDQFKHADVGGCPTGCVATAVTQIMLYHAAREGKLIKGYGSHCYEDTKYGQICADFDGIQYSSDELLSYHVGISMEMQYCGSPYGSVPNKDFVAGLENHFQYYTANAANEDYYVRNELENQRPVYISLMGDPVGHAFVVDGYDDRGYFHVDFGWGGHYNGYYLLNNNELISPNGFYKFHTNIRGARIIAPSITPANVQDSLALVAIHDALGGYAATGWDLSQPVFKWPGVLMMNGRVIELNLSIPVPPMNAQSIAPETGNLTALRKLYLYGCMNGNIPSTLSQLTDLKELQIHNSYLFDNGVLHKGNLKGQLPQNIGNLSKLEWLSISNALQGTIPPSIGDLASLKLLWFSQDTTYFGRGSLEGTIPQELSNLSGLLQLHITNQQLSGGLPASITDLGDLIGMNLSGNQLSGDIPVLNFPRLESIYLNDNLFTGLAEGEGECPELKDIHLQNNTIAGDIPAYFTDFKALQYLDLSHNQLEALPEEIANWSMLQRIKLDNNQLRGLPDGLALLNSLYHLSAPNNQIEYIPSNLGQSRSLITLDLSDNLITEIPEELGNCPNLTQIYLNNNKLNSIPSSFANLGDVIIVHLHNNQLQGTIPEPLLAANGHNKHVTLTENQFVFIDIPSSDNLGFGVRNQKSVPLKSRFIRFRLAIP
jgi:Leucine-rich repeat (LRR) protein